MFLIFLNFFFLIFLTDTNQLPVFFEIGNADWKARSVTAGLHEFTAPEGIAILPQWMMFHLYLTEGDRISITSVKLPRAKLIKFQPVQYAFTQVPNAKQMLENELGYRYCTLTRGTTISIQDSAKEQTFELIVKETEPARSVYTLNSAVSVDFDEPVEKPGNTIVAEKIVLNEPVSGKVDESSYVYYTFANNPAFDDQNIVFEVEAIEGDPDVFVSQTRSKPTITDCTWSATRTGGERVVVAPDDPNRIKTSFWIGIRGHMESARFRIACLLETPVSEEELLESSGIVVPTSILRSSERIAPSSEHIRCSNCHSWVPEMSMFRHEAFCKRNVQKCDICQAVVQLSQVASHYHCPKCQRLCDKENHFHCDICSKSFSRKRFEDHTHCPSCKKAVTKPELNKHIEMFHQNSINCDGCGKAFDLESLKVHKGWLLLLLFVFVSRYCFIIFLILLVFLVTLIYHIFSLSTIHS